MEIRRLNLADEAAFLAFNRALVAEREAGNELIESKLVTDFLAFYTKAKALETAAPHPDWSPVTVYYAFVDGQVAGRISCRWELDKGDLSMVGGHVGYVTSPQFRRQGVMFSLLTYACDRYRERGIDRLFITALAHNLPSRATIEKAGGVLQDIIDLEQGKRLARYWIDLIG